MNCTLFSTISMDFSHVERYLFMPTGAQGHGRSWFFNADRQNRVAFTVAAVVALLHE